MTDKNKHMDRASRSFRGSNASLAGGAEQKWPNKVHWEHDFVVVEPQINADGIHVWPFDSTFPVDLQTFVASRQNVRMNQHRYCELIYIYSGGAEFQVQDRSFQVCAGDLIVVGCAVYHRLIWPTQARGQVVVLYFEPELINSTGTGESAEYLMPFFQQDREFPSVISAATGIPETVFWLMRRIHAELPPSNQRSRLAVKTYVKMALILLVNHYAELLDTRDAFHQKQRDIRRLTPLFDFLESHYADRIRLKDVARICGMSSSHLMYFFKGVTGQSFLRYLNQFRVAKAQELLTKTDQTILEIALQTGFCDQSHFGFVFRKLAGITPLAYRKEQQQKPIPSFVMSPSVLASVRHTEVEYPAPARSRT